MHEQMAAGTACRIAVRAAGDFTFIRVKFQLRNNAFNCTNNFFRPLFAYLSYNFYGAVICIKAVYSQHAHCKAFLGRKFLS